MRPARQITPLTIIGLGESGREILRQTLGLSDRFQIWLPEKYRPRLADLQQSTDAPGGNPPQGLRFFHSPGSRSTASAPSTPPETPPVETVIVTQPPDHQDPGLANWVSGLPALKRVILISSSGVYKKYFPVPEGHPADQPVTLTEEIGYHREYLATATQSERVARLTGNEQAWQRYVGERLLVLRCGGIYSDTRNILRRLLRSGPTGGRFPGPDQWVSRIHTLDLARLALALSADTPFSGFPANQDIRPVSPTSPGPDWQPIRLMHVSDGNATRYREEVPRWRQRLRAGAFSPKKLKPEWVAPLEEALANWENSWPPPAEPKNQVSRQVGSHYPWPRHYPDIGSALFGD